MPHRVPLSTGVMAVIALLAFVGHVGCAHSRRAIPAESNKVLPPVPPTARVAVAQKLFNPTSNLVLVTNEIDSPSVSSRDRTRSVA